jgi:hypothetical protein
MPNSLSTFVGSQKDNISMYSSLAIAGGVGALTGHIIKIAGGSEAGAIGGGIAIAFTFLYIAKACMDAYLPNADGTPRRSSGKFTATRTLAEQAMDNAARLQKMDEH